jgi:hypothetical protein
MSTAKQKKAARANVQKAQAAWQEMSTQQRARAQPQGRGRAKPGSKGGGGFYHVEVRPKGEFQTFRTQDVGKSGSIERVAGKRSSGSWSTQKWLISKQDAHIEDGRLVADTKDTKGVLQRLGSKLRRVRGDRFSAAPRPNVPEKDKPTPAQQRARRRNIAKAQEARHH